MAQLYIAFVDTPGLFAGIIRRVLKQKYIHVALSLDPRLEEAYSIGRRHPSVPLIAGFEKEDKRKILKAFPGADYMIYSLECTAEQKEYVEERLQEAMRKRFSVSLHDTRTSVPSDEYPVLSEKSLYLFVLCCTTAGGGGNLQMGKAFFSCDPERLFRIPGKTENLRGKSQRAG